MRVVAIDGAFGLDHVRVLEREVPEPGPGDVLVRVQAASLNYRDYLMATGAYNPRQPLPLVLASDGAGEIVRVGESVSSLAAGDRVMSVFAQDWQSGPLTQAALRSTLGGPRDGMLAEYVVLPEHGALPIPEHLSFEEASTIPCAAVTAMSALTQCGIGPGQTVLVQGTGGVALFALAFAKLFGAKVIVTSKSDEKLERAKRLGADVLLNYTTTPDWGKEAKKLAQGEGVDIVVEVGGAGTLEQSIRATRPSGSIALIGVLARASDRKALSTALTTALMSNIRIQGVFVGSRELAQKTCETMTRARLRPVISETFPLAETKRALERMAEGAHMGKIVVRLLD